MKLAKNLSCKKATIIIEKNFPRLKIYDFGGEFRNKLCLQ